SGRNITRIARSGFVHHGMNFLFRANVEQAFAQMYGKQSFPMERMDIAALWLLCNSYDNMKVKLPKKTRYGVGLSGKWGGKDAQLVPTEIWCKESDAQKVYEKLMKMNGKTVMAEVVEVNPKVEWRHELLNMVTLQEVAIEELGIPARPNNGGRRPSVRERTYFIASQLCHLTALSPEASRRASLS
ncbi:hypothetical protein, partial [uncultured Duncaniella sp.]|uniref:hypothetical protein n=1 Tax=uncultured Duncaniella sp. TaxID=2768039 RepID=UPI0025A4E9F9